MMKSVPCRTCRAAIENVEPSHSLHFVEEERTLADMLLVVTRIDAIADIALPQKICTSCSRRLRDAFAFSQQAQRVNSSMLADLEQQQCLLEVPIDIPLGSSAMVVGKEQDDLVETSSESEAAEITINDQPCKVEQAFSGSETNVKKEDCDAPSDPINENGSQMEKNVDAVGQSTSRKLDLKYLPKKDHISCDESGRPKCDVCHKTYTWKRDLQRHLRTHFDTPRYQCLQCDRSFLRKDKFSDHLKAHRRHWSPPLRSSKCTADQAKLRYAVELPKNVECKLCSQQFASLQELRQHLPLHKDPMTFMLSPGSDVVSEHFASITNMTALKRIICAEIAQQDRLARFYVAVNAHGFEVNLSDSDEADMPTPAGYTCDLCGTTLMHKHELLQHSHTAHALAKLPYRCGICQLGFVCRRMCNQHEGSHCRNPLRKYRCTRCPARFVWPENLVAHECAMPEVEIVKDESKQQNRRNAAKMPCDVCGKTFAWQKDLTRHRRIHLIEDNKKFSCPHCTRKFLRKDNLTAHMHVHVAAGVTAELATSADGYDAMPFVTEPPSSRFDCTECGRSFRMQKDLTRHLSMHNCDTVYECLWCVRKFYSEDNYHLHVRRHNVSPENLEAAAAHIRASSGPHGTKRIECKLCQTQYTSIAALRQHLRALASPCAAAAVVMESFAHSYSITTAAALELDIDDSETDSATDTEASAIVYSCALCPLQRRRRHEMQQHQRSMHRHEQVPYQCDKCCFRSVSQDILAYHRRSQCDNTLKQFRCSQCGYKFMWQENLKHHMEQFHADTNGALFSSTDRLTNAVPVKKRLFRCEQCKCQYNRKDRLSAHVKKVHNNGKMIEALTATPQNGAKRSTNSTEMRKYLCPICGMAITQSSNLIVHMRRHTGEKPFKCDFCDMAFPRSSDLQSHRRRHTGERPYRCTVCDKHFSRSYKLHTHMRIHSGERPYKCTYCEKSFSQSNDLTLHIRRHTGERPYVCEICGERFIQSTALKNHRQLRGHHKDGLQDAPQRPQTSQV